TTLNGCKTRLAGLRDDFEIVGIYSGGSQLGSKQENQPIGDVLLHNSNNLGSCLAYHRRILPFPHISRVPRRAGRNSPSTATEPISRRLSFGTHFSSCFHFSSGVNTIKL